VWQLDPHMVYLGYPKKSHYHSKKSHYHSKKSKKVKKNYFFLVPFGYKNVDKMFHQPQKVIFSPQKVKKVKKSQKSKKNFFLFFAYCVRKRHIYTYFFEFCPLTPLKNPYYENIKFFSKKLKSQKNYKNL